MLHLTGSFSVGNVVPQANGDSSRVKVKVRVNLHGIFSVATASMLEKVEDAEEPMEVDNGPVEEKAENGQKDEKIDLNDLEQSQSQEEKPTAEKPAAGEEVCLQVAHVNI